MASRMRLLINIHISIHIYTRVHVCEYSHTTKNNKRIKSLIAATREAFSGWLLRQVPRFTKLSQFTQSAKKSIYGAKHTHQGFEV